ncbi:MAG: hypothetical protein Q4G48_08860 [Bacteroidia bacterium]|nr:hypothetical protein [Bacteroidia bacterium]
MKNKRKFLFSAVMAALVLLYACGSGNSNKTEPSANAPQAGDLAFTVDTFSTFPPEIDGCSCYFSNDSLEFKQRQYIYMNNLGKTSFVKINDSLVKFTQTGREEIDSLNVKETYKSKGYEMAVHIKHIGKNGYETWLNTGTITLTDKNGNSVTKEFYGECGC